MQLYFFFVPHSIQHDMQRHRRVWVRKRRLHQLHPDVWRHGPLQGQVWWEAILLRWVVLMVVVFLLFICSSWAAVILVICQTLLIGIFSPFLLPQPTVCARRATGAAWTAAVCLTVPGAMARTTARTTLMKPSATVSWGFHFFVNGAGGAGVSVFHEPFSPHRVTGACPLLCNHNNYQNPLLATIHCH